MRIKTEEEKKFVEQANQEVQENSDELLKIVDDVVKRYSASLDDLMQAIAEDVVGVEDPPTQIVERYFMELSNALYFLSSKVEKLGVYEGIGKLSYKEKFNNSMIDNKLGPDGKYRSQVELTARAEEDSKYASAISDMYSRAYKILKAKVDSASVLNATLSKVLSHRMAQEQLIGADQKLSTRKILNEARNG